jgi:hypothetical protein
MRLATKGPRDRGEGTQMDTLDFVERHGPPYN